MKNKTNRNKTTEMQYLIDVSTVIVFYLVEKNVNFFISFC